MNADSVKARLRNRAVKNNTLFHDELVLYGLERTIYRISVSPYADRFVLKGGILLYAWYKGNYPRATQDIDLLAQGTSNDPESLRQIFSEIVRIEYDDALHFDADSITMSSIAELKKYHGVNISFMAYLDNTRIPVSIDVGFGDAIYPGKVRMEYPVLLDMDAPSIFAYSLASVLAEKFEAIVSLGYANSRFKDFYDLYVLSGSYDLDGSELLEAVRETFERRGTGYDDIVVFDTGFTEDGQRKARWKAFVRKKKVKLQVDFDEVVCAIKVLLEPIANAARAGIDFPYRWNCADRKWKRQI